MGSSVRAPRKLDLYLGTFGFQSSALFMPPSNRVFVYFDFLKHYRARIAHKPQPHMWEHGNTKAVEMSEASSAKGIPIHR